MQGITAIFVVVMGILAIITPAFMLTDPYVKIFTLGRPRTGDGSAVMTITVDGQELDSVSINSAATSEYLAYRPSYSDVHSSNLGAVFVNIEHLFPCTANVSVPETPVCHVATQDEDGFKKGKPYIEMADGGNHVNIWGETIRVYGLAVQGCPQLSDCFSPLQSSSVVCYLPQDACKPCKCNA